MYRGLKDILGGLTRIQRTSGGLKSVQGVLKEFQEVSGSYQEISEGLRGLRRV